MVFRCLLALAISFPALTPLVGGSREDLRPPFIIVLGIAQDGGYPHAACRAEHCEPGWADPSRRIPVSSLAIVDPETGERWMIDATPDFPEQLRSISMLDPVMEARAPDGIFLTHAHIGHYTGLMYLGREVMGARGVPVWAMPRMVEHLKSNAPWDQLVRLQNISLRALRDGERVRLNERISLTPIMVPHRDEYSETVGYRIDGPERSALYIPDIDKWEKWDVAIEKLVAEVDIAWLDGTFYRNGEIPGRDMSEIPHPFIEETIARFSTSSPEIKDRATFIHMNHTNPALLPDSAARREVESAGFRVASVGDRFEL